ncbi:MAG: glycerol-3-phosphate 1-O-acyltransferase PlsY [Ruminococcus sp.]|nr:glycerol-3-phosphate 1-O-acyltransferase PlsY [Ruminococcus sp.]
MKVLIAIILAAALGYFLGSINFSIIIVQIVRGKDIRTMGSKNAGLTNTYRCCGPACAGLTLLGDVCKGVLAVALARMIAGFMKVGLVPDNDVHYIGYVAAFFAIIGHIFPVYYGFKGGKGVLVGAASFLALDFRVFIALIAIFIVILAISKYVSLSSILASAYGPLAVFMMSLIVNGTSFPRSLLYLILSLPMSAVIIWKHRSNIERLLNNTESKFSFSSRSAD